MFELITYNWAVKIADGHLKTNISKLENLSLKTGYPLYPIIKVAIIKGLKSQHPDIGINAIACLIAAGFVANFVGETHPNILEDLKNRILTYGETMGIAWRYLNYCCNIL